MVGITGQRVQTDGDKEVLVGGNEVWEEWTGQKWRIQSGGVRLKVLMKKVAVGREPQGLNKQWG